MQKELSQNIEKACIFLKDQIKTLIGTDQERMRSNGEKGVYYKGLNPSQPGQPPHKLVGFLQRSIAHEMAQDKSTGFVGTNLDYGLYLEMGTSKMAARPWLRSSLAKHSTTIANIINTGSK